MLSSVFTLILAFATAARAVHTVEVQGQDFVDSVTKKRFTIIGVDYQPGGQSGYDPDNNADPLSNGTTCLRDAAVLQSLGVNTIRVYNLDPSADHDECASIFNAAGIYMLLDVNSPLAGESIDRSNPGSSYTLSYLKRIFGVVEAFKDYPNTLGFFSANEVINDVDSAQANPPYLRAVTRDLKQYIAKNADRTIPVGYSAADVRDVLQDTWAYLQCALDGDDDDESRSDFFGLNSYSWCGGEPKATFESSGYDDIVEMFSNTTIPVFFSEYGCNEPTDEPREFNEVQALYGKNMTVLSGGLVYEYSEEESEYGLVTINDNSTITFLQDYDNLQAQYNKLNTTLLEASNATATSLDPPKCAKSLISDSGFSQNFTIPSQPSGAAALISSGLSDPNNGKLVSVTATACPVAVYGVNGTTIKDLAITVYKDNESNLPGGESTDGGSSSTTGTAASPSSTKKGSAGRLELGTASQVSLVLSLVAAVLML